MSIFLHHTSCPKCRSRDNLGVWEDGHMWCFGCGYYKPAVTTVGMVKSYITKKNKENNQDDTTVSLPSDSTYYIPREPRQWLNKYEITEKEIVENKLMWSQSKEMLIFPYYGDSNEELLFWQGRFFPPKSPKTITYGYPNRCLVLVCAGNAPMGYVGSNTDSNKTIYSGSRVAIVEDPVSAIKVARYLPSHCLFGAYLSLGQAQRLARYFKKLYIWLDQDKTKEAMKFQQRYAMLFNDIKVISTELDPKECSNEKIREATV